MAGPRVLVVPCLRLALHQTLEEPGICVVTADCEASTCATVWQKGLLWQWRVQSVSPTRSRGKCAPSGCTPYCSVGPPFLSCSFFPCSLDLFFRWLFDIHFLDEANIKFQ